MTDFNLSKKRIIYSNASQRKLVRYEEKDVKEFIKRLKEDFRKAFEFDRTWNYEEIIDKRAGEKLR